MFRRVISSIRHFSHHTSGFDTYLSNVQIHSVGSGPTIEEAKKDYRSAIHAETSGFVG